jgi:hypothetical protein
MIEICEGSAGSGEGAHGLHAVLDGLAFFHGGEVVALYGVELGLFAGDGLGGDLVGGDGFGGEDGEVVAFHLGVAAGDEEALGAGGGIESEHAGGEFREQGGALMEDAHEAIEDGQLCEGDGGFEYDGFRGDEAGFEGCGHKFSGFRGSHLSNLGVRHQRASIWCNIVAGGATKCAENFLGPECRPKGGVILFNLLNHFCIFSDRFSTPATQT